MTYSRPIRTAILLAGMISIGACQHKKQASNLPIKQYELHGRVVRLDAQTHSAVIQGQEILGWMAAMTMEYPVKADNDYQRLQPGEQIRATVSVQGVDYWIGGIRKDTNVAGTSEVPGAK